MLAALLVAVRNYVAIRMLIHPLLFGMVVDNVQWFLQTAEKMIFTTVFTIMGNTVTPQGDIVKCVL